MPIDMAAILKKQFGDATGPLGFPMRSEDARELETLMESRSAEVKNLGIQRAVCMTKASSFDDGEHADVSFVTTDSLDRDKEVVLQSGIDWKQFRKNPIVTFAHMYDCLPTGKSLWVKADTKNGKDGWLAKTKYTTRPPTDLWPADEPWFPDAVWHFVKSGDLPGKSLGFLVLSARAPTEKEIKARPELASCRCVFDKTMVLEYAVAPVQSNPDAIVQQVSKCRKSGVAVPDRMLDALGMMVPDEVQELDLTGIIDEEVVKATAPAKLKAVVHVSASQIRKSVEERVLKSLSNINVERLIEEALSARRGRV